MNGTGSAPASQGQHVHADPTSPLHVYVHIPFCGRRCSYCDFAIAVRRTVPVDEYLDALERELLLRHARLETQPISTLYLGGGTPSRLGEAGVRRLSALLRRTFDLAAGAEVTIEANPDDVTRSAAAAWREAGVTRVSVGAQSFSDAALAWMHRTHDAAAIRAAVADLRREGIEDVSLDLIFALPGSVERDWERDLADALTLSPTHISLYGLTVEPRTPLGRWVARSEIDEAPEERYETEFLAAHRTLTAAGFEHYEVSNFARPGRRARHNSAYWTREPYAGLGPGAHELHRNVRRWNTPAYAEWAAKLSAGVDPVGGSERLTAEQIQAEHVYLGLRTAGGLELGPGEAERIERWISAGWADLTPAGRLTLTPLGWLRLDALASDLTMRRSHS